MFPSFHESIKTFVIFFYCIENLKTLFNIQYLLKQFFLNTDNVDCGLLCSLIIIRRKVVKYIFNRLKY